jgi:hypothetical protein
VLFIFKQCLKLETLALDNYRAPKAINLGIL